MVSPLFSRGYCHLSTPRHPHPPTTFVPLALVPPKRPEQVRVFSCRCLMVPPFGRKEETLPSAPNPSSSDIWRKSHRAASCFSHCLNYVRFALPEARIYSLSPRHQSLGRLIFFPPNIPVLIAPSSSLCPLPPCNIFFPAQKVRQNIFLSPLKLLRLRTQLLRGRITPPGSL